MPTVMVVDGLRVVIYPNDHRPPHVHPIGRGCEARFALDANGSRVGLLENRGFSRAELSTTMAALNANLSLLMAEWERIHGD